ncbi:MAG: beta-galactosidase [Abditibacteriota bacterium]|nr:beta-galactosidase [Abditibacteriota bacterium]
MIPKNEYPEPQALRSEYLSLNGEWLFAETDDDNKTFFDPGGYPDKITVPYCRESELSGLGRKGFVRNVWYTRTFTVPSEWKSERVRLHIGACDYKTALYINGFRVTVHKGGSAPIVADITPYISEGENEVIVHAFDDTRSGSQPLGKQSAAYYSAGCHYTRTTGIWQSVWLEGVGRSYIDKFVLTADINSGAVFVRPIARINEPNLTFEAVAYMDGKEVGKAAEKLNWRNTCLPVFLSEKRLWSLEDPYLYDMKLILRNGDGEAVDEVSTYFGLREVTIDGGAVLINGKPVFQRLVLDQGFYPYGIWTAPTDEALVNDIKLSMAAGFNGARLHQKVFEPRFLYHADRLGYLVWGEYPNWGLDYKSTLWHNEVINEWREILERDRNHPAIVGWCPFNETPPEAGEIQNTILDITRAIDPTRPMIDTSGWHRSTDNPDICDSHNYDQCPASFRKESTGGDNVMVPELLPGGRVPFFVSEYGGIGWTEDKNGWGYGNNPKSIEEFYERLEGLTKALLDDPLQFGFCYTQLTDVEQEQNGVYYYDRSLKFDMARIKSIFGGKSAYEETAPVLRGYDTAWTPLVESHKLPMFAKPWKYRLGTAPEGWQNADFDDSAFREYFLPAVAPGRWYPYVGIIWDTEEIICRREFNAPVDGYNKLAAFIDFKDEVEVYLNGVKVLAEKGGTSYMDRRDLSEFAGLVRKGRNVIAVRVKAPDDAKRFFDIGLFAKR